MTAEQKSLPAVAAIVVNLNGRDLLKKALASLLSQEYGNTEITVVDNGSTDGSQEMVHRKFPTVRLIENKRNLGFGGANNVGIHDALSRGAEYVFLLNYDATVDKNCLVRLVDAGRQLHAGITGSKIYYHSPHEVIWSAGGEVKFWTAGIYHRGIRRRDEEKYDRRMDVSYLTACSMLISRDLIEKVGDFDKAYFPSYCEDVDLCVRATRAGFRVIYEPGAVAWHRVSSHSGGGITPLKVRLRARNQFLFFKRYARWYHWIIIPFAVLLRTMFLLFSWLVQRRWRLIGALGRGFGEAFRAHKDGE